MITARFLTFSSTCELFVSATLTSIFMKLVLLSAKWQYARHVHRIFATFLKYLPVPVKFLYMLGSQRNSL